MRPVLVALVEQLEDCFLAVIIVDVELEIKPERSDVFIVLVNPFVIGVQLNHTILAVLHTELNKSHQSQTQSFQITLDIVWKAIVVDELDCGHCI